MWRALFLLLLQVWQVGIINPQIFKIYFRCVSKEVQRFPQARLLTTFSSLAGGRMGKGTEGLD
jgi:hypothetical protein